MIAHIAAGIYAAQARARVHALAVDARPVRRAVRVDHALGPAVGRRADHLGQACALATVAQVSRWV